MNLRRAAQWIGLLCALHSSAAFVAPSHFPASFKTGNSISSRSSRFVAEDTRQSDAAATPPPMEAPPPRISTGAKSPFTRVRRLRDLMWVRETLEDLTAAEFAINLDNIMIDVDDTKQKRKRAVDYDNLLTKLNRRIMDLGCEPQTEDCEYEQIAEVTPGRGMGSIAYSDQQRETLFK